MCLNGSRFARQLQAAPPIITNNMDLTCFKSWVQGQAKAKLILKMPFILCLLFHPLSFQHCTLCEALLYWLILRFRITKYSEQALT